MICVRKYTDADRSLWNDFLQSSRTPHFLFSRNFMEYHKDRFEDHSLMVFDGNSLVALFPANIRNNAVVSHGGLTFGGIVVGYEEYTRNTIAYISSIVKHCKECGVEKILFKQSPAFYSPVNQDEVDYAFFILKAQLSRVDIAYAIDQRLQKPVPYQERRRRAVKKAIKNNIVIKETDDFSGFWNKILTPNLQERFGVNPVHSLEEIQQLSNDNPGCIRQFEAWQDDTLMAGTTVFETPQVAHAQYISACDEGRRNGAIDLLFDTLITATFKGKHYFDFGIVNELEGRQLNLGLLDWKEGFGARAYAHRFYEIDTSNYNLIEDLFTTNHNAA